MFSHGFYDEEDPMMAFQSAMMRRSGAPRRFDEYFRCYPVAMMPGPEREAANHGGKVFMPASALEKLTRLHITYPMLFELINGAKERTSHAGVLEFIAEEGKIYLPFWLMQTLLLEPGDLLQVKSTDLPPGQFIKLQPQATNFLDITDPKAVLENVFRNFACLTKGDIFTFAYNDQVYEMAVLECKPETNKHAIGVLETDLSVDFAPPIGYEEPVRKSGTSTPKTAGSGGGLPAGGLLHHQGTMAQSINYSSIAPSATTAAAGSKAVSSNFLSQGQKLSSRKSSKAPTPQPSTPIAGTSTNAEPKPYVSRKSGPQPLRLPPGMLFFGYEIKPLKKKGEQAENTQEQKFQGAGQSLRGGTKKKGGNSSDAEAKPKKDDPAEKKSTGSSGRTLRDLK
ncbi:UFD1-domain-containing protein [Xylona heveae TC161]|uniref:Ubiquitin fusion degradation protein 1 n=1 Tax=Xylona heveae (strain CBS 132557 / TC161) TaxID=1328760 RepID=A0A165AIW3_XYLHT|nr:UFD1-domain-containing protein [Xylona heveae TC161]KZF20556.1 UFD1-domain-containing protein [Xylona heveae TC161]